MVTCNVLRIAFCVCIFSLRYINMGFVLRFIFMFYIAGLNLCFKCSIDGVCLGSRLMCGSFMIIVLSGFLYVFV